MLDHVTSTKCFTLLHQSCQDIAFTVPDPLGSTQTIKMLIYPTTLRDGSQGENISFSLEGKLHIARKLDESGVDCIEGGWPGSNAKDAASGSTKLLPTP